MLSQSAAMRPAISEVSGRPEFSMASSYDAKRAIVAYVLGRSRSLQNRRLTGFGPPCSRRVLVNSSPMARISSYFEVSYSITCTNSMVFPSPASRSSKSSATAPRRQPATRSEGRQTDGVGVRDQPARGDVARERLETAHQLLDCAGRRRREQHTGGRVGGALDQRAEITAGVGGGPVFVDQLSRSQPPGGVRPLLLGPAAARAQQVGGEPALRGQQHVRFAAVEPGTPQRGDVAVAPVLADRRAVLPHLGDGVLGRGDGAVGGVQRA